jgi:Amt family ammonium transporter
MGLLGGAVTFFACTKIKEMFKYDDALDTFGVHAVGGTLGALLTGIFATDTMNPNLAGDNMKDVMASGMLWLEQLKAMGVTLALSIGATVVLAYAIKATVGLRPNPEDEETGLDLSDHGERGYHLGDVR